VRETYRRFLAFTPPFIRGGAIKRRSIYCLNLNVFFTSAK